MNIMAPRALVIALYVFLLLGVYANKAAQAEELNADVIIIGAGMCGIMAGKMLTERGITNLLILEATDRIGGRIRRHDFLPGVKVEDGANWVEGVNGDEINPIWSIANDVKLRTFYSDLSNLTENTYDKSGLVSSEIVGPVADFINNQNEFVTDLSLTLIKDEEQDVSVITAQRLYGRVPSTPLEMCLEYQLYDWEYAEPPRVSSLKKTWPNPTFANFGPDLYYVADPRGFVTIFQNLTTYLQPGKWKSEFDFTDPRLKFHKVVNKIEYKKSGVTVYTEDGSKYTAKAAILTVSIGVLQSSLINFEPDLPFWKLESLYQYDMAIFTKIYLKFPSQFWPTGEGSEYFNYADDTRGYYPIWQHLDSEYPGQHIIFVTVTDTESKRIEQQSFNQTQTEAMAVLRSMFGSDIPDPEAIYYPRWWGNRFFGGSYTNWPIGINAPVFREIRAPIDNLYFAGEATSDFYNGYVHGAYFEGISVAKKVAECLQKGKCESGTTRKKKEKRQN